VAIAFLSQCQVQAAMMAWHWQGRFIPAQA
jgi:hypothetical protein